MGKSNGILVLTAVLIAAEINSPLGEEAHRVYNDPDLSEG